jgi:hypothetical protein
MRWPARTVRIRVCCWRPWSHASIGCPVKACDGGSLLWREVERDLLSLLCVQCVEKGSRCTCDPLCLSGGILAHHLIGRRVNNAEVPTNCACTQHRGKQDNLHKKYFPFNATDEVLSTYLLITPTIICGRGLGHNRLSGHGRWYGCGWLAHRFAGHTRSQGAAPECGSKR